MQIDEAVKAYTQQRKAGQKPSISDRQVSTLLDQVKFVGGRLRGTDDERRVMRGKANGMLLAFGQPHIFLTVNFSDLSSPVLCYFAGLDINLDLRAEDLPVNLPTMRDRALLIARDPAAAAK